MSIHVRHRFEDSIIEARTKQRRTIRDNYGTLRRRIVQSRSHRSRTTPLRILSNLSSCTLSPDLFHIRFLPCDHRRFSNKDTKTVLSAGENTNGKGNGSTKVFKRKESTFTGFPSSRVPANVRQFPRHRERIPKARVRRRFKVANDTGLEETASFPIYRNVKGVPPFPRLGKRRKPAARIMSR